MGTTERPYLVLGLDPGISSCGFALLDMTNRKILEMGSHLFDAPQEPKSKTSLAVTRRNARSIRRNTDRTQNRQKHCLKLLIKYGLAPERADKQWLQTVKGDKPLLKLRASGLDNLLTDRQFAQVLYALSLRRGYIPHGEGKSGAEGDTEGKAVLSAIDRNSQRMAEGGFRTIGEMLAKQGSYRNKGGKYDNCVYNSQIVDEAHELFQAQRRRGNNKATKEFEDEYVANLIWEKKTLDHDEKVYSLVGKCSYFGDEKRAALADLSSELCRAYERFGHLVVVHEDGSESSLDAEQRNLFLQILFSPVRIKGNQDCKVRYIDIRNELQLSAKAYFKGIDQDDEKKLEPFIPKAWRFMRKAGLPTELMSKMLEDRNLADAIGEALSYASSMESLQNRLSHLDLNDGEMEALTGLPFASKVFKGYGSRSLKALHILLDMFEEENVLTLYDAEEASGLDRLRMNDSSQRSNLLMPYNLYDDTCNNPVVLRSMGRMRHIVNAIIRIYGVPDEIHVELGRELKQSKKEKDAIARANRKNMADNRRLAKMAAEFLSIEPELVQGKLIRKLSMWEDQGQRDAYTGAPIKFDQLVSDDHYAEIDHILPYSRTCDDSRRNKVLVLAKTNQDKGARTPYEWMTQDASKGAPNWDEYRTRVMSQPKLSGKRRYLLNINLGTDAEREFINRNLNDTRYMSRAVKNYLEDTLRYPDDGKKKHVIAVAGGATSALRHVWGLNFGEGNTKDRSDNRHHAVDAAVIAACSEGTIQAVAKARSLGRETYKHVKDDRLSGTQPWPSFATEVIAKREFVIPTRMVNHGVTGRAFEDTAYRFISVKDEKSGLSIISAGGKSKVQGNLRFEDEKTVRIVDGMAFLRLWLDPTARPKGKIKGQYYAEPVYYADIPAINNGTYTPKVIKTHTARGLWPKLPEGAKAGKPIILRRGDVLVVDNHIGRYQYIDINGAKLHMLDIRTGEDLIDWPSLGKWGNDTSVYIIKEDCLGHCYQGIRFTSLK